MAITYTNRMGVTYYLCQGTTKRGQPRYYFASAPRDSAVDALPSGYVISESINGVVSLTTVRASAILDEETTTVETVLKRHPDAHNYRVSIIRDRIVVHEREAADPQDLREAFGISDLSFMAKRMEAYVAARERRARFTPVLRFCLVDAKVRLFLVERRTYRGKGGWLRVCSPGSVGGLAAQVIPTLGRNSFFELF